MSTDLYDACAALALRLPGRGHRSVRVTRVESNGRPQYIASACVSTTTGAGVEECAVGIGATPDGSLNALEARLKEWR